ncbi:MAG: carboxymuconolactone decarboxylase family protein [Alphaproteobacteria bacterium]
MSLKPISEAAWPPELADMAQGFAGKLNVYRTMAHHPALVRAWASLRTHVVVNNVLGEQASEIVILRIGHHWKSDYEWTHHVVRGRAVGLSDARIESMRGEPGGMTPGDRVLAEAVDALLQTGRLPAAQREALIAAIGEKGVLDVMATIGMYTTLAFIVNTFETPIDANIAPKVP